MLDEDIMNIALIEAKKAAEKEEVPVGAVIIDKHGDIISKAHNQTICFSDPSAHAEILALREACSKIKNYRLLNATLYVTVEPCIMCMGAIIHARVSRVVFGAFDPKWGGAGSLYDLSNDSRLNHRVDITCGVNEPECRALMQNFFYLRRIRQKQAEVAPIYI